MKKKTDYIEDEGMAYDEDLEMEIKKDQAQPDPEAEKRRKEKEAEEILAAAVHERRMVAWEQAARATQHMAAQACKAMKTEFKLRVAQLLALVLIAVILLAK